MSEDSTAIAENETWRQNRHKRCIDKTGWLSLAGLHFLEVGDNTIGSDKSCSIRFEVSNLLPNVGVVNVDGDTVTFVRAASATGVCVDGREVDAGSKIVLSWDEDNPTVISHDGSLSWLVMKRGTRFAIRLRDANNPVLLNFKGIDMYPIDLKYRVVAKFEKYDQPRDVQAANVLGDIETEQSFGLLRFTLHGVEVSLQPLHDPSKGNLFIVFGDKTTGGVTYGGGRMLYVKPPVDGECIVDFNQAYNPPCVFTPFCTCPIPIKENRLPVAIEAGEKAFHGY